MATTVTAHGAHAHDDNGHAPSDRLAPFRLFDQPQGHRHDVPGVRAGRRADRRHAVDRHAARADVSGPADLPRRPHVQRVHHRARPDHDLLHGDAGDDRRLRQLDRAADDRSARHGVPAHEQHLVLAAAGVVHAAGHLAVRRGRARARPASRPAGRSMRRSRPRAIPGRRSISRSCRCISPAPPRSSARSTSSPPSSTCARPA